MDKNLLNWVAEKDMTIGDDLRLVMMGMQHIDSRIKSLQMTGLYVSIVLTAILIVLSVR